jgi:hypothetical protein
MLYIYILNELVTPNPTATGNPIVNVYVSSDDMSFNVCDSGKIGKAAFFAKPGDLYSPASTYIDPLEPMEENEVDPMGGSVKSDDTLTFLVRGPCLGVPCSREVFLWNITWMPPLWIVSHLLL